MREKGAGRREGEGVLWGHLSLCQWVPAENTAASFLWLLLHSNAVLSSCTLRHSECARSLCALS